MNDIKYFFNCALRSFSRGKIYYRPWKNLLLIIFLVFSLKTLQFLRKSNIV